MQNPLNTDLPTGNSKQASKITTNAKLRPGVYNHQLSLFHLFINPLFTLLPPPSAPSPPPPPPFSRSHPMAIHTPPRPPHTFPPPAAHILLRPRLLGIDEIPHEPVQRLVAARDQQDVVGRDDGAAGVAREGLEVCGDGFCGTVEYGWKPLFLEGDRIGRGVA